MSRAGFLWSAAAYTGLGLFALQFALGGAGVLVLAAAGAGAFALVDGSGTGRARTSALHAASTVRPSTKAASTTTAPSTTAAAPTTVTTTRYAGDSAQGLLTFQPPDPTACNTATGVTTAGISGAVGLSGS